MGPVYPSPVTPSRRQVLVGSVAAFLIAGLSLAPSVVAHGSWGPPTPISQTDDPAVGPSVAADPHGNAVAVWRRDSESSDSVQAAYRPAGGSWSEPVDISAPIDFISAVHVAMDDQGNAVAVWDWNDNDTSEIQAAVRPAGGDWSDPETISDPADPDFADALSPDLAMDPAGNATVVWTSSLAASFGSRVRAATRPAGGSWSDPETVSTSGGSLFPSVAVDREGDAMAVWDNSEPAPGGPSRIFVESSERPSGDSWQDPQEVISKTEGIGFFPDLALDGDGDAAAGLWQLHGGGPEDIVYGASRPIGGDWTATPLSEAGENAQGVDVAADAAGNAVLLWQSNAGTAQTVRRSERPAGGDWGSAEDASGSGAIFGFPQVELEPQGNALAAWDLSGTVFASERPAGGSFTAAHEISSAGEAKSPMLDFSDSDSAVAVWQRDSGGKTIIEAADYGPGSPGAGPAPPSPQIQNARVRPTLADLPDPVLGKVVNVDVLAGTVLVGLRGSVAGRGAARASQKGITFVPLTEARQVPVGSFLDTRRGKVRLQSASDPRGTRQQGDFSSGLFQVLQSRKASARGLTDLLLKGSSFRSCPARGKRARASGSVRRRLRSSARGRFRTRGRYSAATVRGTVWLTADRCDGTLTKVSRGRVAVRDFRRRRTVVVRAGKSYLARAP